MNGCSYLNFNDPADAASLIDAVLHDEPEARWRSARALTRLEDSSQRAEAHRLLEELLRETSSDWRLHYRIILACRLLEQPLLPKDRILVRKKGVYRSGDLDAAAGSIFRLETPQRRYPFPVIDFHVHPKLPDGLFLTDLLDAGISHAVILATDTDPDDIEQEDVQERVLRNYMDSSMSIFMDFPEVLVQIHQSLFSPFHTTNQDVADWIEDYPDQLVGFGSVNLSHSSGYVKKTLDSLTQAPFRGVKLLPFSQFFDPAANENMDQLMTFCQKHHMIVLSHTGCAAGVFEDPLFSRDSRPSAWTSVAKRYPDVPIVLAHFGAYSQMHPGIWFEEALDLMAQCDNVYADTAAVWGLLHNETMVQKIRAQIGFDRVLFGTDYPMPTMAQGGTAGVVSEIWNGSVLTETEKLRILGGNAAQLLGMR